MKKAALSGSFFCMLRADVGIGPYGVLPYHFVGGDDPVAVPKISALPYGGRLKF